MLATASTDKIVKIWDVRGKGPVLLAERDLKVGAVFSACFCGDDPFLLAAGGSKVRVLSSGLA